MTSSNQHLPSKLSKLLNVDKTLAILVLESVDKSLLRGILKAHTKTPKEFLYLETGSIPLKWVISQRRLNYLKHILNRDSDELIKKVYLAPKEKPTRGDFVKLVENDLKELGIS